jgi:hypothetical protein
VGQAKVDTGRLLYLRQRLRHRAHHQRAVMSPIFGSRSFPPGVICHLALAVKRMACR